MFAEKLRAILKFGTVSTRYKDIFDLYWLSSKVDTKELMNCFDILIFSDSGMKENNLADISKRVKTVLMNDEFRKRLSASKKNWLDKEDDEACNALILFIENLANLC